MKCQWFLLCPNEATTTQAHPILGDVPVCNRCKEFAEKHKRGEIHQTPSEPIIEKTKRSLSTIAAEIRRDWKKPYFGAAPYLNAMSCLEKVTDQYICDSGKSIVCYFLANASTWRGETAKRIKKELKQLAGI